MEQQQTLDIQSKGKSFFKAKWFPGAVASLALVISIGGHAFTAFNSVGYVQSANKIGNLEASQSATERADGNQDRAIQSLNAEVARLARALQAVQTENVDLRRTVFEMKAGQVRLDSMAKDPAPAKKMQRPLPNGVNERFDLLVRSRMKPFFEAPFIGGKSEAIDDEDFVVLQFAVDRQGLIKDVQVVNSSGQTEFDNSAVKAALRMNAIPEIARLNDQAYAQVRAFRLAITPNSMKDGKS